MTSLATLATGAITTSAFAASTLVYATVAPPSQLFGPVLVAGPDPKQIALTYDDGPNPAVTPHLLDVLARNDVRATFFLIGNFVRLEPALTRRIAAEGHILGNHTMSHPRLPLLSSARIREELSGANSAIEDAIGAPVGLFRPPHGWRRPAVLRIARELGMTTVQWNVMVGDWKPVSGGTILDRMQVKVARNRRRGVASNIVLHDGGQAGLNQPRMATIEATERLLQLHSGTKFVTPDIWL